VQIATKKHKAKKGEIVFIPKHTKHRITGISSACIFEVSFGKISEKDIIRYADDYGRI
jgi:hypothetical protein